jgi:uncharacterized membrane protein YbhN (UPF0104 family)
VTSYAATAFEAAEPDPLAMTPRAASMLRRLAPMALLVVAGVGLLLVARGPAQALSDALGRAVSADPRWVVAAIAFEIVSFAGYVFLFWHVAGRDTPRIGLRESYNVALAGTAATRLLPTAGAGGAALTYWTLKRAGQKNSAAARTLLTFLVLLYSVFLGAVLVAGTLLATHAVTGGGPRELSAIPAAGAGLALAAAIAFAIVLGRRATHQVGERRTRSERARHGAHMLGRSVRDAIALVRGGDVRLLGAPAWWAFDLMVLWATFHAFGQAPPAAVLVLGYFLGQVANTIPIPGAVSGGMIGVFLAFGMPSAVVLPAVLAYRAVAIWTPVAPGAAAIAGLRRTVRRWSDEEVPTGVDPVPA